MTNAIIVNYIDPTGFVIQAEAGSLAEQSFIQAGCIREVEHMPDEQVKAFAASHAELLKRIGVTDEQLNNLLENGVEGEVVEAPTPVTTPKSKSKTPLKVATKLVDLSTATSVEDSTTDLGDLFSIADIG